MYVCIPHVCNIYQRQIRELDTLELKLQIVVNHHMSTEKTNPGLLKVYQVPKSLSHFSSLVIKI